MDGTDDGQLQQPDGESQDPAEGTEQAVAVLSGDEGDTSTVEGEVQEEVSQKEPVEIPKTIVEYVPVDQVRKMQSSFDKKLARQQQLITLQAKALQSRQRIDPLSENSGQLTKEEVAYESYLVKLEDDQKTDVKTEFADSRDRTYSEIGRMLASAGIVNENTNNNKTLGIAYRMMERGDFDDAKELVADHIKLRAAPKTPAPPKPKPAPPKGAFRTEKPAGAVTGGRKPTLAELQSVDPFEADRREKSGEWIL